MGKSKRSHGDFARNGGGGDSGHHQKRRKKDATKKRRNNNNTSRNSNCLKPDMYVNITRVELTDDHAHAPAPLTTGPARSTDDDIGQEKDSEEVNVGQMTETKSADTGDAQEQVSAIGEATCSTAQTGISGHNETKGVRGGDDDPAKAASTSTDLTTNTHEKKPRQPYIKIIKTKSAKWRPKFKHERFDRNYKPLPNGDCGDGIKNPHPKDEVPDKFWAQRRRLFSRYDEGIQLDKESWYSVTPEAIADHIAHKMARMLKEDGSSRKSGGAVVLDAFCGCGGNAVAFAKLPPEDVSLVVCIDIDRSKLEMAAHNAALYGIARDRIVFIEADAINIMQFCYSNGTCIINPSTAPASQKESAKADIEDCSGSDSSCYRIGGLELLPTHVDAVFLSPPWGGKDYNKIGKMGYKVAEHIKIYSHGSEEKKLSGSSSGDTGRANGSTVVNGEQLLNISGNVSRNKTVAYFLPRNINGLSLGSAALKAGYRNSIELEQNVLNGKLKTCTAYFSSNNMS
mmetsp:Transcript_13028/g.28207  ORF Transcript_13028/g.28207 Transcript_13028/m.28207 type:complete len:512 (-) Transcript_13028:1724-3259(-)|eukprot:CAMPEP_0178477680 /NCGR_PEP_ID=MMETSP0696-20121128/4256_1 /TAXON_ID=265572 /ORGANISM="Extubocellulus spinifer, Strain CCMP396" /LENGTH=511 /DNA_ID=CAMNT_0020104999 /DNA_START=150 /DNA_END=1685 /DNA_ORIENTATION=+